VLVELRVMEQRYQAVLAVERKRDLETACYVRRVAWQVLDHAWEIEDRLLSRAPRP